MKSAAVLSAIIATGLAAPAFPGRFPHGPHYPVNTPESIPEYTPEYYDSQDDAQDNYPEYDQDKTYPGRFPGPGRFPKFYPGRFSEPCSTSTAPSTPAYKSTPTPGYGPVHFPVHIPVHAPVYTPESTPEATPKYTPEYTPEHVAYTPVATPVHTPAYTPVHTPVYTPVYTPVHTPEPTSEPSHPHPGHSYGNHNSQCAVNPAQPEGSLPEGSLVTSLLVPVSVEQPDKAFPATTTAEVTPGDMCTVFNFEIPYKSTVGKLCNLVFDFPSYEQAPGLFEFHGPGHFTFTGYALDAGAVEGVTTYNNPPAAGPSPPNPPPVMEPGHSYVIHSGHCGVPEDVASITVSGMLCSADTTLTFSETNEVCPLGFYVVFTDDPDYCEED